MGIMNLSEIMDKAVDIVRKYFKSLILFTLGYGAIVFTGMFIVLFIGIFLAAIIAGALANTALAVVAVSLTILLIVTFYLSYQAGIIKIASQEFIDEKVDTYKAFGTAFKNVFKIMGLTVICILMFLPIAVVFLLAIGAFTAGFSGILLFFEMININDTVGIIIVVIMVLSFYLMLLAYFTWVSVALQAMIIEKKGVFKSIRRSFSLVRKSFWRILGCLLLFYLSLNAVNISIYSFLALVISIVFLVLKLLSIQPEYLTFISMVLTYLQWPVNLISWLVVSPMGTAMITLIYFNQRFKKEGYDLTLKLKAIQKNDERKQTSEAFEHSNPSES